MLDAVKQDLRISHNKLDEPIQEDIATALAFIENAGVIPDENDPLVSRCVKDYCRWKYDYDGEGEKYEKAFYDLLATMSLSQERKI